MSTFAALASGLLLALVTSGGILGERISGGDLRVALFVNVLVTAVSMVVLVVTLERERARARVSSLLAQLGGAALGITFVHLVVRYRLSAELPWLAEGPAQLVNDATAAAATLVVVWACARRLDARILAGAFVLVTVYRFTAAYWHRDHAPGGFALTVQQLVVAQFAASALGLLLFTHLHHRRA